MHIVGVYCSIEEYLRLNRYLINIEKFKGHSGFHGNEPDQNFALALENVSSKFEGLVALHY